MAFIRVIACACCAKRRWVVLCLVECNEREIALGRGVADKIIVELDTCEFALIGQPNCGKEHPVQPGGWLQSRNRQLYRYDGQISRRAKSALLARWLRSWTCPARTLWMRSAPRKGKQPPICVRTKWTLSSTWWTLRALALGLELTLELLPLNKPVIVALNMMDEADRLGLRIDGPGLQKELGTPVLPLVASKGRGV